MKILFLLLMPTIILTAVRIGWPDAGLELVCLVYVVPGAVLNAWEFEAEINEALGGKG